MHDGSATTNRVHLLSLPSHAQLFVNNHDVGQSHMIPKLKNTNNLEHLGTLGHLNRDWKILLAVGDGGGPWARRPQYKIVFYRSVGQSVRGWWWQVPICFLFTNYHVIGVSLFLRVCFKPMPDLLKHTVALMDCLQRSILHHNKRGGTKAKTNNITGPINHQ